MKLHSNFVIFEFGWRGENPLQAQINRILFFWLAGVDDQNSPELIEKATLNSPVIKYLLK